MKMHVIFKVDRPVKPVCLSIVGQAKAEFPVAGIVSFGRVIRSYCTVDVEKPDHVCAHIETIDDAAIVSALLHEKMFKCIHQFFSLVMHGESVPVSYIAGMYIEFGHFMLNIPDEALVLPNVLESYLDIVMDFNYDLLDDEMEHLQFDSKALRIGNSPANCVVIPFRDGRFDMKPQNGWTYTVSTYDTKTHTIRPQVYQMVMHALDVLEKMDPEQAICCIDDPKRPWRKPHANHMRLPSDEQYNVSTVVIHYTRNGLPKEIVLKGVWG